MNISKKYLKKLITPLILLVLPFLVQAQNQYHDVLVNDTITIEFVSVGSAGSVTQISSNGHHILNGQVNILYGNAGGSANPNILKYIPNSGFLGQDSMKIGYWSPPFVSYNSATLYFNVVPAVVIANDDHASTPIDSTIVIDVLSNDESNGVLTISNVPLANHGTVEITPSNEISFTPASGFEGMAYFNYTVCDEVHEVCDVATVKVFVESYEAKNDTIHLVTLKNKPIEALIPLGNGFQVVIEPDDGTVEAVNGVLVYSPGDYVGSATFRYAYNTNQDNIPTSIVTFIVDVLWAEEENGFAMDDYAFTAIETVTSFNVLSNDLNNNIAILTIPEQPSNGEIAWEQNGTISYTPDDGFEGLDQFTYKATVIGGSIQENATVYIVVSNQTPEQQDYQLTTPAGVPLVLNYDIPITNYDFVILTQNGGGLHGAVAFFEGNYEGELINGQQIEGYNLVIYSPHEAEYVGFDEFEIQYCVGGDCQLVKVEIEMVEIDEPQEDTLCVGDCVWAGDANYDGKVDMTDLLPVGYCVGEIGDERINGGVDWYGQFGDNWNGVIGNTPTNIKHVDTDGDGFIGAEDTVALSQFYGLYHDLTSETNPPYVDIPLFFVPQTPNPEPGDLVVVDIVLGTPSLPALDMYGLTFKLNFNEEIIEPETMNINFYDNNWLAYNSPTLSMVKEPWLGRIEAGYTRANGIAAIGYGIIGQVSFVVIDEIDGNRLKDNNVFETTVTAEDPISMNSAGRFISINAHGFDLYITKSEKSDEEDGQLIIFPNPSSESVTIHLNGDSDNEIEQMVVYSLTGQVVHRVDNIFDNQAQLDVSHHRFANGMYIISAITAKGVINGKVEILK